MNDIKKRILLFLICIVLLTAPSIFWGNLYMVGGDDTRLYYIFPQEMLRNYAQNIISNNSLGVNGGYGSVNFFAPILLIVLFIKTIVPFANSQMVLYGLNFAFGFILFYKFLGLWLRHDKETTFVFFAKITASLFYLFSFFVLKTIYSHQLIALYIVSVFPGVMYFFMRSLQERKIFLAVLSAFMYSAFSSTILTLPWFGAMVFSCIPISFVWMRRYTKQFFLSGLAFILVVFCLNIYWLFHQIYPMVVRSEAGIFQYVISSSLIFSNIDLIEALSHLNAPIHQMASYIRSSWTDRNNLGFSQSYGIIYIATILLAGIFLPKKDKKTGGKYILSILGLLLTFMLVCPNFGDWNINVFIFFNNHIPLFAMFRNMYDKFAPAVSFQFGFALFIALVILGKKFQSSIIRSIVIFLLLGVTLWNAHTYLFSNKSADGISGVFNKDYVALTRYVKSMGEPSRFVWLPLNFSSYSVIEDALNPGHFYYGSSPLQFLAGTSDYIGFQSFVTSADPDLNFQMLGLINEKKFDDIGRILQRMNAKYLINYHYDIPNQYFDHMNLFGSMDQQKDGILEALKGEKIRDFGSRYSLYAINEKYHSEKIFLTDSFEVFPDKFSDVFFKKISPSQYDISVNNPAELIHIAFLEPFDSLWELHAIDMNGAEYQISDLKHMLIYRFGNGWTVLREQLKSSHPTVFQTDETGNETLRLRISFRPQKYTDMADAFSVFCWGMVVIYLIGVGAYHFFKKKKHG